MTDTGRIEMSRAAIVETAVRSLVRVHDSYEATRITLPVFYPSGSVVTVEVTSHANGYRVSDGGLLVGPVLLTFVGLLNLPWACDRVELH